MMMLHVQLIDRQEMHNSCGSLESLVSMLNDYSDALRAIVPLQRNLSKALKHLASLNSTRDIAANAFNASANIFDVLSDVDSKFAKLADNESHGITSHLKKWLNILAQLKNEEKAHDERMNHSNTRIKQAGLLYEKKAKKSTRDAAEEHASYLNLLSVLGPDMSQEKYNHALLVTQQHTFATYSVAACISKVADAEWARTCETIRRFSPSIGPLGEWRTLCEAAWTAPIPDDLPDLSPTPSQPPPPNRVISEWGQTASSAESQHSGSLPFPSHNTSVMPFTSNVEKQGSINSITSLSAFPFPPTHFPIPLPANEADLRRQRMQMRSLQVSLPSQTAQQTPLLLDSPKPIENVLSDTFRIDGFKSPPALQGSLSSQSTYTDNHPEVRMQRERTALVLPPGTDNKALEPSREELKPRRPSLIARATASETSIFKPLGDNQPDRPPCDRELGTSADSRSAFKSRNIDVTKTLEHNDCSVTNGSIVATMRNRYSRTTELSSQAPKDVPRLPMSVSDLASRYQPIDEPMTPRRNNGSPTVDRHMVDQDHAITRDVAVGEEERKRKQRIAEPELKEKGYENRQREQELNQSARVVERNRMQFLDAPGDLVCTSNTPKGSYSMPFQHKRGSHSTSHLVPPPNSTSTVTSSRPPGSRSPSRSQPSSPLPAKVHALFCGCDTCSVTKYKIIDVAPSPHDLRPPEPPILLRSEKPRGWIRRLSMPSVGAALDARKNANATSTKLGLPSPAQNGRRRKRSFEQGISNRSVRR